MSMCDLVASKSKDESIKVGCVIVGRERRDVRATGYNGFPRGVFDDHSSLKALDGESFIDPPTLERISKLKARLQRPMKYLVSEHAERNAIYSAAAVGVPLAGCMLYVNSLPPCADCARAIIQSGIVEVIHADGVVPERWRESCDVGLQMMLEADIVVGTYKKPIVEQ